jgi:hypothetical protein
MPYNQLNFSGKNRYIALLSACFTLASYLLHSSTLKMKTYSSKASVDFQRTVLRYVQHLHNRMLENPKSYDRMNIPNGVKVYYSAICCVLGRQMMSIYIDTA